MLQEKPGKITRKRNSQIFRTSLEEPVMAAKIICSKTTPSRILVLGLNEVTLRIWMMLQAINPKV